MNPISIKSLQDLDNAAKELFLFSENKRVFAFYGAMGVGKTTFIKTICKSLGAIDNTSSPTFSIINEYHTDKQNKVFHFDFYRIKNETEAMDLGVEEYFYSGNYCFIEWSEKIPNLIPENAVKIKMTEENGNRILRIDNYK